MQPGYNMIRQALEACSDIKTFKGFNVELYLWGSRLYQMHFPDNEDFYYKKCEIYELVKKEKLHEHSAKG